MKYKVSQSMQSRLENDLNKYFEQGYEWECKLCSWETETRSSNGDMPNKDILITYLLSAPKDIIGIINPDTVK